MKKILSIMLMMLLMVTIVACNENVGTDTTDESATEPVVEETEEPVVEETTETDETTEAEETTEAGPVEDVKIGLVTDTGGIDDKSFNQGTYEGLERFFQDNGLNMDNLTFLQSTAEADYIPNLSQYADEKKDLIVAPGFLFEVSVGEIAQLFPEQKILIIDTVVDAPNVVSAVFAEHEGSFLVGVAAALKAQEMGAESVGFIGGLQTELIGKFQAGYEQGVAAVDPNMKVDVQYASGFNVPEEGASLASVMYDSGSPIIYHAAGGTGNGVFKEARDRAAGGEEVWVIGVDKDQYEDGVYGDGSKSVTLTSMVKAVDEAGYRVAEMVKNGNFEGGAMEFDLAGNGVRIPEENPNLKPEWVEQVQEFAEQIKNGEIEVSPTPAN